MARLYRQVRGGVGGGIVESSVVCARTLIGRQVNGSEASRLADGCLRRKPALRCSPGLAGARSLHDAASKPAGPASQPASHRCRTEQAAVLQIPIGAVVWNMCPPKRRTPLLADTSTQHLDTLPRTAWATCPAAGRESLRGEEEVSVMHPRGLVRCASYGEMCTTVLC